MTTRDLTKATMKDVEDRDAALVAECCARLVSNECPAPEAGAILTSIIGDRLPLIAGEVEKECSTCGEPIYGIVELGRRKIYCRGAINAIKFESLKPTHLEAEPRLYWDIEYKWGTDGFIAGAIKHSMTLDALAVYLAQDKVMKDADGNITLLDLDA